MNHIEAMKLALNALEKQKPKISKGSLDWITHDKAITALRQAIAQAENQCQCRACKIKPHASDCAVHNEPAYPKGACDCGAIEQAEKQEPVATVQCINVLIIGYLDVMQPVGTKLYTSPPPRQPLTDEDLRQLADKHLYYQPEGYVVSGVFDFARAIEAAHGIKE